MEDATAAIPTFPWISGAAGRDHQASRAKGLFRRRAACPIGRLAHRWLDDWRGVGQIAERCIAPAGIFNSPSTAVRRGSHGVDRRAASSAGRSAARRGRRRRLFPD